MKTLSPLKSLKGGSPPKPFVRKKTPLRQRPAKPPVALPRIILTQLEGISAKVLRITWTHGLLWIAVSICGILLVQASLDWLFDLAWHIRFIFALCDLALLGWLAYRYIVRAFSKQLTPEQAALRAEVRFPALRTSLISAVQLAKSPEGSTRMVEILIQQVAKRAAQMNFASAVDAKHLKKLTLVAVSLSVVTAGLYVRLSPKSDVLLGRILLSHEPLPTQTIVIPISHDFSVPAGQNIEISAKAKGIIPRAGSVEINYEDGKGSQTVSLSPKASEPDTFALALPNVQQGLTYRFRLNDGRGDEYKVVILHGPILQKVTFEQNYPAYTGLAKTELSAGNLTLLAGSRLHVEGRSDQELKSAHIQLKGIDQQIPMTISDGKSIAGDITIPVQGLEGFSIVMENTDGIPSPNNTVYRVEVTPDKPPEITYDAGQPEDKSFVEADRPELHFKVVDDFQVRKVFLCVENVADVVAGSDEGPNAEAAPGPEQVTRIPIDMTPAASLKFDYVWKTAADSGLWKEGKTVNYWIEAEDNNNVTGPGIGKSGKRQWRIISVAEMQKQLRDKEKEIADKVDDDAHKQDELREGLGNQIKKDAAQPQK